MRELLASGRLSMGDFAWYEGCAEWTRIHDMPEVVAAVLPPIPNRVESPLSPSHQPGARGALPIQPPVIAALSSSSPVTHSCSGGNPVLWPDPPMPRLPELQRKLKRLERWQIGILISSALLVFLGWLVGESRDDHHYRTTSWIVRAFSSIATSGPFGYLGVVGFILAFSLHQFLIVPLKDEIQKHTAPSNTPPPNPPP